MQKVIGFDTETVLTPENGFLVHKFYSAQFFSPELKINVFTKDPAKVCSMFNHKNRGAIFLALNAEFDFSVLAQILKFENIQLKCLFNKSRFLYGKVIKNGHAYHIYDLMNIFTNWSLAKLGAFLGVAKMEKPTYLGHRAPDTIEEKIYFQKYAMRDAEIAHLAGVWLNKTFGRVRMTLPSLAFWYFNTNFKHGGIYLNSIDPLTSQLRLAYKGGRCEAFVRGTLDKPVYAYDVVSLYPSVMLNNYFPVGIKGLKSVKEINFLNEGFAYCTVKSDLELPFLCLKHLCGDGNVKLVFPNGIFTGYFTYPELRFFKNELKQEILTVHSANETDETRKYFKPYIKEFFSKKKSDPEHANFWKLFMNSLYGKFAQDAHSNELNIKMDGTIFKSDVIKSGKIDPRTNILISAYITAYARIKMYRLMSKIAYKDLLYTDTDSIHTLKPIKELGDGLGDLAFVSEGTATYIRSKFYLLGEKVTCRGMEKIFSAPNVRKLIIKNDVECASRTLLKLRSAYRQHKPFLTDQPIIKHFSILDDRKRIYIKSLIAGDLLKEYTYSKGLVLNGLIE